MKEILANTYKTLVLKKPAFSLAVTLLVVGFFAWHIPDFKLDASGDSLVLENDADLYYSRQITERYGTGQVLVVTYTAEGDLFAPDNLAFVANSLNGCTNFHFIHSTPGHHLNRYVIRPRVKS